MKIRKLILLVNLSLSLHFINAIRVFSKKIFLKAVEDGKVKAEITAMSCSDLKSNLKSFCKDIPAGSNVFCGFQCILILCKGTCVSATRDDPLRKKYCEPSEVARKNPNLYQLCTNVCKLRCPSSIGHLVCVDEKCGTANGQPTSLAAAAPNEFNRGDQDCKEAACCCDFKSAK